MKEYFFLLAALSTFLFDGMCASMRCYTVCVYALVMTCIRICVTIDLYVFVHNY